MTKWNHTGAQYSYKIFASAAAKSLQLCLTLCDPVDGSPPGSPVPGILQARTLEWVAISISNAWKWKVKRKSLSHVWFCATPWTAAHQAPPSMGFSRQEYWSGVPLPTFTLLIEIDLLFLYYLVWGFQNLWVRRDFIDHTVISYNIRLCLTYLT